MPDGGRGAKYRRLGAICRRNGKLGHAVQAYRQAIALDPDDLAAQNGLAAVLAKQGDFDAAADVLHAISARYGATPVLQFRLAAIGRADPPPAAPKAEIAKLFDSYATRFDRHLLDRLEYRAPQLLFDAVAPVLPAGLHDILDLGCGTGLCGALFKPMARSLAGVDLSPRMIDEARRRNIYDRLWNDDLVAALAAHRAGFDLLLASDVLIYLGDLGPVFRAAKGALRPGGLFGYTVEAHWGEGSVLRPTRRYAHSSEYLERLAGANDFETLHAATETLRLEEGQPVPGHILVLRVPVIAAAE